jgi:Type I phosphodiesterase / nucleotide pyrophosphatase
MFQRSNLAASACVLSGLLTSGAYAQDWSHDRDEDHIRHVLLISVDGMHAVDYFNCSKGINGVKMARPYCPNLAALGQVGVNYLETSASKPSDSFPGLMAIVSGGSPRTIERFMTLPTIVRLTRPQRRRETGSQRVIASLAHLRLAPQPSTTRESISTRRS